MAELQRKACDVFVPLEHRGDVSIKHCRVFSLIFSLHWIYWLNKIKTKHRFQFILWVRQQLFPGIKILNNCWFIEGLVPSLNFDKQQTVSTWLKRCPLRVSHAWSCLFNFHLDQLCLICLFLVWAVLLTVTPGHQSTFLVLAIPPFSRFTEI